MYDTLLELPLFRGVSRQRISEVIGTSRFDFLKYLKGNRIIEVGQQCHNLTFILSGTVRVTLTNASGRMRISQTLTGPDVIMPQFLFGRETVYPCSVDALDTCSIMQVSKTDWLRILTQDQVFMLNYLNILGAFAQNSVQGVLASSIGNVGERLAVWIVCLTQASAKDIVITCKQRDLYGLLGVQRSSFVAVLQDMADHGIITYSTNKINVLDRRAMLDIVTGANLATEQ